MWDLTIPGAHDFYIDTTDADILVHDCSMPGHGHRFDENQQALIQLAKGAKASGRS